MRKGSGASNKTISKVIRTLKYAGVLDFKHRAHIGNNEQPGGKESNEYFFIFEGIGFYRNKLTKEKTALFKKKIKEARIKAIADMEAESTKRKQREKANAIPSHSNVPDTVTNARIGKSQNVNNDIRNAAGLRVATIPSHFTPIPSQMLRRSNKDNVQQKDHYTSKDTTIEPCNKKKTVLQDNTVKQDSNIDTLKGKKQKTVRQDEFDNSVSNIEHDSDNNMLLEKKPSSQSINEWLEEYENAG